MPIDGFDWQTIDNTEIDPDSPLTSTLCAKWRDNQEFLMRWLGRDYRAAAVANHNHDGSNSAPVAAVAPNSVAITHLKTTIVAEGSVTFSDSVLILLETTAGDEPRVYLVSTWAPVAEVPADWGYWWRLETWITETEFRWYLRLSTWVAGTFTVYFRVYRLHES
jgi:hypothetical protein